MLLALGLPLPKQVFGHPWMLFGEDKMSKSRGNVIYADDLVHFFGVDAVRYFVLSEMPFAQDGSITWQLVMERINSELANVYGNLVNRTIAMTNKYFNGQLTEPNCFEELDQQLIDTCKQTVTKYYEKMDQLRVADAIDAVFDLLRRSNKYIDETSPWTLAKQPENKARLNTVLYNLLESIRVASVLLTPFMPETSKEVFRQINTEKTDFASIETWGNYEKNNKVVETTNVLFARVDEKKTMDEIMQYMESKAEVKTTFKEEVSIEDFDKLDIRIGTVMNCQRHPKADKLLVFDIKCGSDRRTIVSGIAQYYQPEDLIGKKVAFIANLAPRKLRGIESKGMILSAEDAKGNLEVVTVDKVEDGADIR